MKIRNKLFISLLILFSTIFPTLSFAASTETILFNAKVTADLLYVRSGPAKTFKKVDQLKKGVTVKVYEQKNSWYRIDTKQKWVTAEYLKKIITAAVEPKEPQIAKLSAVTTTTYKTSKPSTSCFQAIKKANSYCSIIAKGCTSYSKTEKCVDANLKCEDRQKEALSLCPLSE